MLDYPTYRDTRTASTWDVSNGTVELAATVREQFNVMRRHRDTSGVSERMMFCLRNYNGEYSPQQLAAIRQMGGSEAFAKVTSVKARTLSALLEEIYLGTERPWRVEPTPLPTLPVDVIADVEKLITAEVMNAQQSGQGVDPGDLKMRMQQMHEAAMQAAQIQATKDAKMATTKLDDQLVEGGFYQALRDFLINFSIYPFSVLKGPFFRVKRTVKYIDGQPAVVEEPLQSFSAPSPFDIWFSPGVSRPQEGDIVERIRISRFDLEALRLAPTYDADAIDEFLEEHPKGHTEQTSSIDQERADAEEKESPLLNDTGLYDLLEFHGWIDGEVASNDPLLSDYEFDPERSHHITVRLLGNTVIGAHPNPDPLERPIFHVASFEPVPGSVVGRGLPEAIDDAQAMASAGMRNAINNMAMASGPQVGINTASLTDTENGQEMYPWKRWSMTADPAAPSSLPLVFFQPNDNSQAMLAAADRAMMYADEASAIPRYAAGSGASGGAQRTASGLAMLQGNVQTVIKHIARGIDVNIFDSVLQIIYSTTLLTDESGLFRGDETIKTLGVEHVMKREADKVRAIEFLQLTGNPIDMQIMGPQARAFLLTTLAEHLGFDHGALSKMIQANIAAQAAQAQAGPPGGPPGAPGQPPQPGGAQQTPKPPPGAGRVQEGTETNNRIADRTMAS